MYTWGDNEFLQQAGSTSFVISVPTKANILHNKITRVTCGSSHCIAITTTNTILSSEFTPVPFSTMEDPLGSTLLSQRRDESETERMKSVSKKRPTLATIVLSLSSHSRHQDSLGHILTALQIAYARDAIVNSLGGVVFDVMATEQAGQYESNVSFSQALESVKEDSVSPDVPLAASLTPSLSSGLDSFTGLLTVEDGFMLVNLLKLAVAGRAGDKGQETLSAVLTAMAQAKPEVRSHANIKLSSHLFG